MGLRRRIDFRVRQGEVKIVAMGLVDIPGRIHEGFETVALRIEEIDRPRIAVIGHVDLLHVVIRGHDGMNLFQIGQGLAAERNLVHGGLIGIGFAAFGDNDLVMVARVAGHERVFITVQHAEQTDVERLHPLEILHPDANMRERHFR
jgi:hypothetical protein